MKIKCPICKGKSEIEAPHLQQKMMRQKQDFVKILRKEGYSIREIMKVLGYKSPRSVAVLLEK